MAVVVLYPRSRSGSPTRRVVLSENWNPITLALLLKYFPLYMCINCSGVSVLKSLSVGDTKHWLLAYNDVVYYTFIRGYRYFLSMVLCSKSECTAIKSLDSYSFLQLFCCHFNKKIIKFGAS